MQLSSSSPAHIPCDLQLPFSWPFGVRSFRRDPFWGICVGVKRHVPIDCEQVGRACAAYDGARAFSYRPPSSVSLSMDARIHSSTHPCRSSTHLCICPSMHLSIHASIYAAVLPSVRHPYAPIAKGEHKCLDLVDI